MHTAGSGIGAGLASVGLAFGVLAACGGDEDSGRGGRGGASGSADAGGGASGMPSGGAAGAAATAGADSGHGGADGSTDAGGSSGEGGSAAADAGCGTDEKTCGARCVSVDDPAYGCSMTGCDPCDATNGTAACSSGSCTISCEPGFDDCDGDPSNGCETTTRTDAANCGACGNACTIGACTGGVCDCGNGAIDGDEECDDGNVANLDGCDSQCRYETVTRMTSLNIQTGRAPSHCATTVNQFGTVFPAGVVALLNNELMGAIDDGQLNVLIQLLGLDDLTGQNDADLSFGILTGELDARHPGSWTSGSIDWWFVASDTTIDPTGLPSSIITGARVKDRAFEAGPAPLRFPFSGAFLTLLDTRIRASVDSPPAPDVPAAPPSALAAGLEVFRSISADGAGQGLCGNVTIESLSKIALPETFAKGGIAACVDPYAVTCTNPPAVASHEYVWCGEHCGDPGDADYDPDGCTSCTPDRCYQNGVDASCNSLLDAMVGGCVVNPPDCPTAFIPTQPDIGTGGSPPNVLTNDPGTNKVSVTVETDAYSAWFAFRANRAHVTNNLP